MFISLIFPLTATMESLLRELERSVLESKLDALTGVAVSLAAACCAISLIGIGSKYLKGMQFDWWQFVRPILIFILVCNFSTFVLGPVRGIAGVYNVRMAEAVGASTEEFKALFREQATEMCRQEFGQDEDVETFETKEDDGSVIRFLKKVGNKMTKSFFKINEKMNLGSAVILSGVMFFFLNMSLSVMVIIANIYLIIMALIGPFTFALSILTTYTNGIKLWVERYIQYTFWQPLLYTFMYIGTQIMILGNQNASWGGFWAWCFMCIAIFTVIKQVPGIASLIIESAGTEALANQLSGLGGQLLQKASSASMIIR
ncbi:MAG: hypothetical protein J6M23_06590 [Bacteroidales bacterium]|nr:hypothetical protein [Bacteroidales bacterium]